MNENLKTIFGNGITVNNSIVPAAHLRYDGNSTSYIIWTVTGETPEVYADDGQYINSIVSLDVDVFACGDLLAVMAAVKNLLKTNGWVWVDTGPESFDEETKQYRRTLSFEKEV